jgi:predicted helicase
MSGTYGYIYIRTNELCNNKNLVKMGITGKSPKQREYGYTTYEHKRGHYISIYKIDLKYLKYADLMLKRQFKIYNQYIDCGTEYYDPIIVDKIEVYLKLIGVKPYKYTQKDIKKMQKKIDKNTNKEKCKETIQYLRYHGKLDKINLVNLLQKLKDKKLNRILPNEQQQNVLDTIDEYYQNNDIGKIIWACGLGKALLSIMIAHKLNFKTVLIGAPSINLLQQIKNEILKLFPNINNILSVCGKKEKQEENISIESTTDKDKIKQFYNKKTEGCKFIITTYHSCHKLIDFYFDFKIGDEAHHLVGVLQKLNTFLMFHKICSHKTLFMTATEKYIKMQSQLHNLYSMAYSMDDPNTFGELIDGKSIKYAIDNKKITDYNIIFIKNTEDELINILDDLRDCSIINRELYMSCYMCLKAIFDFPENDYNNPILSHMLLYVSSIKDAKLAENYLINLYSKYFIEQNSNIEEGSIYIKALHSNNLKQYCLYDEKNRTGELTKFKNAKFGIIPCIYLFGEGFDIPKLNGVCPIADMYSEIRIVQYLLRPNRLDIENPNKIANIIIPYILNIGETSRWKTILHILEQMRHSDSSIDKKIKFTKIGKPMRPNQPNITKLETQDYDIELASLQLKLISSNELISENEKLQCEYDGIKKINQLLNIQSMEEYALTEFTREQFINDPETYFKPIWKNYYDFLGVNTTDFIKDKKDWIVFCESINITSQEEYDNACKIYKELPKMPECFYIDFSNILFELNLLDEE